MRNEIFSWQFAQPFPVPVCSRDSIILQFIKFIKRRKENNKKTLKAREKTNVRVMKRIKHFSAQQ